MSDQKEKSKRLKIGKSITNGGRALNAIWHCPNIDAEEKMILLYLGSQMDFMGNFDKPIPRYVSSICQFTSLSESTVKRRLKSLAEKEYVVVTQRKSKRRENLANAYTLTDRIFEEYWTYLESKVEESDGVTKDEPTEKLGGMGSERTEGLGSQKMDMGSERGGDGFRENPFYSSPSSFSLGFSPHTLQQNPCVDKAELWSQQLRSDFDIVCDPKLLSHTLGLIQNNVGKTLEWMESKYGEWSLYLASLRPHQRDPSYAVYKWAQNWREPYKHNGKSTKKGAKTRENRGPEYYEPTTIEELERMLNERRQ